MKEGKRREENMERQIADADHAIKMQELDIMAAEIKYVYDVQLKLIEIEQKVIDRKIAKLQAMIDERNKRG